MGEELGNGIKIATSVVVIVAILSILLSVLYLTRKFENSTYNDIHNRTDPRYEYNLKELTQERFAIPVPCIYNALKYLEDDILVQLDFDINGTTYADRKVDDLLPYTHLSMYVRVVEAIDGLHVWVGDYPIVEEGWVKS